tara:strand:- start:57 stop:563 length:507 start_codon:yes stop_codon:yes gene_type:complete
MTIPHSNVEMTKEEIELLISIYPVVIYTFPLILHYYYKEWSYMLFFVAEIIMFTISSLFTKRKNKYQTLPASFITYISGNRFRPNLTCLAIWSILGYHLTMLHLQDKKDTIAFIHLFAIPINISSRFTLGAIEWMSFSQGLFWGYVLYWLYKHRHYLKNYYIFLKQIK